MQRNIIFVATNDPAFEKVALDAIMGTRHGMRKTGDSHDVWRQLTLEDTEAIDLAVIDVDFDDCGMFLLHVLCNCEPGFPILAVTSNADGLFTGRYNPRIHYISKPVTADALHTQILELCSGRQPDQAATGGGERLQMVS